MESPESIQDASSLHQGQRKWPSIDHRVYPFVVIDTFCFHHPFQNLWLGSCSPYSPLVMIYTATNVCKAHLTVVLCQAYIISLTRCHFFLPFASFLTALLRQWQGQSLSPRWGLVSALMNVCHLWTGHWDIIWWKVGSLSRRSQGLKPLPPSSCLTILQLLFLKWSKWGEQLSVILSNV